jgi:hypothetical protein
VIFGLDRKFRPRATFSGWSFSPFPWRYNDPPPVRASGLGALWTFRGRTQRHEEGAGLSGHETPVSCSERSHKPLATVSSSARGAGWTTVGWPRR